MCGIKQDDSKSAFDRNKKQAHEIVANQIEIIDLGSQNQNAKKVYFHTIKYDMCFLHFYCNKIQIYFQTSSFKLYSNIA